jgi:transposase
MVRPAQLETMDAQQLRTFAAGLIEQITQRDEQIAQREAQIREHAQTIEANERELRLRELRIAQLVHEMAVLKRWKFAAKSERLDVAQRSLLDETIDADLAAMEIELAELRAAEGMAPAKPDPADKPRRASLPANLPRTEIRHEPETTTCSCGCQMKRIGEDVAEKLDYVPGVFTVERHIRGKWACTACEKLIQAPVPAQVIDKGIPTAGLLAQVLVSKYADHMPLYRQEQMFGRAGVAIPRSTLAEWVGICGVRLQPLVKAMKAILLERTVLHGDETPVAMLKPGNGKTHRSYLWSWCSTSFDPVKLVVYDFADSRSGLHAREFLRGWQGKLVCDDYVGYKALFEAGVTEIGCMAHARRKLHELWVNHSSQIAEDALVLFKALYEVEREVADLDAAERWSIRQARARPITEKLYEWFLANRQKVPDGSATAKAIDYSLKRWVALTRYLDDGNLPIDNNWVENRIRPVAIGRSNWLFAGSLRAGKRAAVVMSLIQSARLNGLEPLGYLRDILERLPTHRASRIDELLPHRWKPAEIN